MNKFSLSELLALREWLSIWESSITIDSKFINEALRLRKEVDKTIWTIAISKDTPWGEISKKFIDNKFEETLKFYFGEKDKS